MKKENKILIIITMVTLVIDQLSKILCVIKGWNIPKDVLSSNITANLLTTFIAIVLILRYVTNENKFIKMDSKIFLILTMSGAIGNTIDRIWNGNVIVFLNFGKGLELNLAYIYIFVSWIGLAGIITKNSMKFLKEKNKKGEKIDENKKA